MIPIVDDYLQAMIISKLRYLKDNLVLMDYIFQTSRPETVQRLKDFLSTQKLKVMIGFPREQTSLPAYVITLAPEQEQPSGLGDNFDTYGEDEDIEDDVETVTRKYLDRFLSSTFMDSTYRIECWSDNGDLTAYMHSILKWCLWTSRGEMLKAGWTNITVSGSDLEPVPDYMPVFIYRRAVQLSLKYDAMYHDGVESLERYLKIVTNPDDYIKDSEGNIIDKTGDIIFPVSESIVLNQSFY